MSYDVKYIGMDVHKEAIVIAVLNEGGKLVMESVIETRASSILQFLHGLRGELHVTWEEGTWAAWLYDLLQPQVPHIVVCNPRRNALLKEGSKNLYLIHTPFAFQPGDEQDPRDQNGNVLYDHDVTLLDTWKAMESLVDHGKCRAIGLSDISLNELKPIYESARIKPAVVQVEAHPYLPETELLEFCKEKGVVFLAFAPLGHGMTPGPLEDPVILAIAARVGKTPAQVLLAWAVQRGTSLLTTPRTVARARENFDISPLPEGALDEINRIQTRQRLNAVVTTGIPGFIPQGR
jgi:diketogulonate reductase-like aldo/keto reductase